MLCVGIFLLFLSPVLSAAADIYVSSSDGINNTSCWTGGVQTPCATLDLAIQGAATAQSRGRGGGGKSGIIIYLLPGTYTATVLEQRLISNNVSIISMRNENEPIVPRSLSAVEYSHCLLNLNVQFINLPLLSPTKYFNPSENVSCDCDYLKFTANITNQCTGEVFDWKNELKVCINADSTSTDLTCTNEIIKSKCDRILYNWNLCNMLDQNDINYPDMYYELSSFCYNYSIGTDPYTISLSISTIGPTTVSTNATVNITTKCRGAYDLVDGYCVLYPECNSDQEYCPYTVDCRLTCCDEYDESCMWHHENTSLACASCPSGNGVPINNIKQCVSCHHYLSSILVFIGIEILPMTLIVLIIVAFNIQLTNGSINGLVFYFQIVFVAYSDYIFYYSTDANYQIQYLYASPSNVFNLDFTPFLGDYSLCIAPHMSPLGAISFWYVVGFYPLLLLLLLYVWITLYDKGYKCVVLVTRPFHRCMARFWSMAGIEPFFTHSIASIYMLCFTPLTIISVKILRFNPTDNSFFFYDANQKYFEGPHIAATLFSVLVLLVFVLLPTLCILFYRFKWFHKLLDCLHLRKQLLISLGDVFTGPYKNGTNGTYDYRFFAGLYLLLKILIFFCQFLWLFSIPDLFIPVTLVMQCCLVLLLALMVFTFRPFQRNIHNFCEALVLVFVAFLFIYYIIVKLKGNFDQDSYANVVILILSFNCLLFLILLIYIIVQLCKIMIHCGIYCLQHNHTNRVQEEDEDQPLVGNDDDWIADRMENPQEYDEQHVPVRLDDLSVEYDPQDNTVAANYGSISTYKTIRTEDSS